jgi:diacylglycerol kinase (ATP)
MPPTARIEVRRHQHRSHQEIDVPHPLGTPLLIANPVAGAGRDPVLARLRAALDDAGVEHDVVETRGRGQATDLARRAVVEDGRTFVVAVGGDGTVHEIVNGLVDARARTVRGQDPVLGIVSAGSGSDLVRTFGLDRRPEVLAKHLATDATTRMDLGHISLVGPDGAPIERVFANIAQAGFGGTVVQTCTHLPRRLGSARYPLGIVVGWGRFRRVETSVTVDSGQTTEPVCNVVVANGQFFGGGMQVAPHAIPSDGFFNVQSWGGKVLDVVRANKLLRTGRHLERPDMREWRSATATVDASQPLTVEADGEVLGTTPARFEVLPGILRLKL